MTTRKTPADWTPDHVRRLWDWYGSYPYVQPLYFTNSNGDGIAEFLRVTGRLSGKILDYGCGTGGLLERLLPEGLACYGVDLSPASIEAVNRKFSAYPNWQGGTLIADITTPFPDDSFDVITCVETLEHLPDDLVAPMLAELRRLVRPGGLVMITTPHRENFEENLAYCPFCDTEFHKWQHQRVLDVPYLTNLLQEHGFRVEFCRGLDFREFQDLPRFRPLRSLSLERFSRWLGVKRRRLMDRLSPRPFPEGRELERQLSAGHGGHLCALATKDQLLPIGADSAAQQTSRGVQITASKVHEH